MSTSPFSFEKKHVPHLKADSLLDAGWLDTGSQFIYIETGSSHDRHQPTFLELEQPRGTKIIDMNQEGHIIAEPNEKQRIATFGLGGCTAVGVVATFPDGTRRAHVQHYDPFRKRMDGETHSLEEMILTREAEEGAYATATKVDAVIMVPGRGINMTPDDPAHAEWLEDTIKKGYGEATTVSVAPYSTNLMGGQSPYATALVIDIPAEGSPDIFPGMSRVRTEQ